MVWSVPGSAPDAEKGSAAAAAPKKRGRQNSYVLTASEIDKCRFQDVKN